MHKKKYDDIAQLQIQTLSENSAYPIIQLKVRLSLFLIGSIIFILGFLYPFSIGLFICYTGLAIYFCMNFFRFIIIPYSVKNNKSFNSEQVNVPLPTFTILIPLKEEGDIIHQTFSSIININYPKNLIQAIVIIEEDDMITKSSINKISLPDYFHILKIPSMPPFTKGRPLMHGLQKATGEYITIFDAESLPEPDQLLKVAHKLSKAKTPTCFQAKIKIANAHRNVLTKFFAAEYYEWFEKHIARLSEKNLPFGLAGNSFYIQTKLLKDLGAWDPFNVTEDADLTVRLVREGVQLKLLDSYTYENCPDTLKAWTRQRTRWDKGLFITQLVHLRHRRFGFKDFSFKGWIYFWLRQCCGSLLPYVTAFIVAVNANIVFSYLFFQGTPGYNYHILNALMLLNVIFSISVSLYADYYIFKAINIKMGFKDLFLGTIYYWLINLMAGSIAYKEYIFSPIKWNKTNHDVLKI